MIKTTPSLQELMNSIVPISRFNKGEANKIFEEVANTGVKFVMKNNTPVSVLVDVDEYQKLIDEIEDLRLLIQASTRLRMVEEEGEKLYSQTEIMELFGVTEDDLENVDIELE